MALILSNKMTLRAKLWLEDKGLKLAKEKTKLIFLMKKCIPLEIDITTFDITLMTRKVVNYLGILLDPRLTF